VYDCSSNGQIIEHDVEEYTELFHQTQVKFPKQLTTNSKEYVHEGSIEAVTVEKIKDMYIDTFRCSIDFPGVVFHNKTTGERFKYRGPAYESIKKRKGHDVKLLSQYLHLRKTHSITPFLEKNPQFSKKFSEFREKLHAYTDELYNTYVKCYVKKEKKLGEYPYEFRTNAYKLHHDIYLPSKEASASSSSSPVFITKGTVISFVNDLHPSQQMVCLNMTGYKKPHGERHTHSQEKPQ
jgi:hypothetical protein